MFTAAVSRDGQRAVVVGAYPHGVVFDLTSDRPVEVCRIGPFTQRVNAVAFSSDGALIVTGSEGKFGAAELTVCQANGEARVSTNIVGTVRSIAVAPTGLMLVGTTASPPVVVESSEPRLSLAPLLGFPVDTAVPWLALRERGGALRLYGVTIASELIVWDIDAAGRATERRRTSLGAGDVVSMDVSPDGAVVAVSRELTPTEHRVELWAAGDP